MSKTFINTLSEFIIIIMKDFINLKKIEFSLNINYCNKLTFEP